MNSEDRRLQTFSFWPTDAPIDAVQLARAGFFATENFLETECHRCGCRVKDWQVGDQITDRHRILSPNCEFVANIFRSENIFQQEPKQVGINSEPTADQHVDVFQEQYRLATFKNWPNPNISPTSLAKAGFYYLNRSDEVKCAWCKGVIAKWEKNDNAFTEHQRFFPSCPRAQLGPLLEITHDGVQDLGIHQLATPKKPKFSSLDARLRTFSNWPISNIQQPQALAQAGLYYQDIDDQVRCFCCNIGLRSWQKEDDPWFEHAKWYPQCQFVYLAKGKNYIDQVVQLTRQIIAKSNNTPITTEEAMKSFAVKQAIEMGIEEITLYNLTEQQLRSTGKPFDTVENLIKALFGDSVKETQHSHHSYSTNHHDSLQPNISTCGESNSIIGLNGQMIIPPHVYDTDTKMDKDSVLVESENLQMTNIDSNKHAKLEEENRKLKDARLCKICLDEEVGIVFLPCGHLVSCVQCAPGVNQCPMCRTEIKGFVRTFLS